MLEIPQLGYFCYHKHMEIYIIFIFVIVIAILARIVSSNSSSKKKIFKNNSYLYFAKRSLMSKTETDFFIKLDRAVSERYYVFPQVHLSALLDHKVKGQEWKYAFSHINGKSVDYVLCDKSTLIPVYAIELDDFTHDRNDRIERDKEVERIFQQARLPLVRFKDKDISESQIIQALIDARQSSEP